MSATLIAAWPKNSREEIRVNLDRFKERDTIDIRVWWFDGDERKPGRSGITLAVRHLASLAEALAKALVEAERRGLLSGDAET
jgi:hypothetical protein